MAYLAAVALIASLVLVTLTVLPLPAKAWNIPGHMLSAAIAYPIFRQDNPPTIAKIRSVLEFAMFPFLNVKSRRSGKISTLVTRLTSHTSKRSVITSPLGGA
jgi:hypothetical protein